MSDEYKQWRTPEEYAAMQRLSDDELIGRALRQLVTLTAQHGDTVLVDGDYQYYDGVLAQIVQIGNGGEMICEANAEDCDESGNDPLFDALDRLYIIATDYYQYGPAHMRDVICADCGKAFVWPIEDRDDRFFFQAGTWVCRLCDQKRRASRYGRDD